MQITPSAFERRHRAFAAALFALLSLCLLNRAPLRADDVPDGDYDGFEDVAKDDNGKPIFVKDDSGKGLLEKHCGTRITNICNAGKFASPDDERFFSEFMDTKIGELTWKDNLSRLPDLRTKFRKYFPVVAAAATEVHDKLNKMVLEKCKKIVADERFQRAVRVNGMLMIGELNQQEKRSGDLRSVVTLPEARSYLVDAVDQPKLHDALRVAAMDGLERHAGTNPTADARKSLKDKMLQLLSKKNSAPLKSKTGQDWVRVKAADILGILANEHEEARQADVAVALLDMAAEADLPLWMRCQAVGNMRKLKNFPADKVLPAARQLAELVVEVSALADQLPGAAPKKADVKPAADAAGAGEASKQDEKNEAAKKTMDKKKKPDPKKSDQYDDDENAAPVALAVRVSAKVRKVIGEELVFCLSRVKLALTGSLKKDGVDGLLAAANDPNARKSIEELVAGVDKMLQIAMDGKREYSVLVADLEKERTELEQWLKTAGTPKPGGGKVGSDKSKSGPAVGRAKTNADVKATVGGK